MYKIRALRGKRKMDELTKVDKKEINRLTLESIDSIRLALSAAVQAGAEARAMVEYVKAIDHLENAYCHFGDDDDDDTEPKPDSPEPDDQAKEFESFRSAVSAQISGVHVGLGLIRR